MSQQEFEPQQQANKDIYRAQYPYSWSDQAQQEGMPRDEPPSNYDAPAGQSGYQEVRQGEIWNAQVPWWARPQPRQTSSSGFLLIVVIVIVITLALGGLGIAGVVFGALLHILGILLGAIFALLLFALLLLFLILAMIRRAIRNVLGQSRTDMRRRGRW